MNVAKYSPSGFYIASGGNILIFFVSVRFSSCYTIIVDQSGKVRIWDTVNKEHILKNEFHPIGGPIKDIAWSPDNQRMVVVGEGRERFGHVFMSETGTSVGEISGQSKPINSCDFRPTRPFRIITGSEDNTIAVFEGPPFKFKMTKQVGSYLFCYILSCLMVYFCYRTTVVSYRRFGIPLLAVCLHLPVLMVRSFFTMAPVQS